jgi:hypothetical protein
MQRAGLRHRFLIPFFVLFIGIVLYTAFSENPIGSGRQASHRNR